MITQIFIVILGAAIGSFLNVLIDRLSQGESIMGRSHCDRCKHTLSGLDLVPVLSFVFLKGKCRYCKTRLSFQYPLVEIATAIMFLVSWSLITKTPDIYGGAYASLQDIVTSVLYLALVSVLIVIFGADFKYRIIPDEMQIAFLMIAFFIKLAAGATITGIGFSAIEGIAVMLPILLLHLLTRGRGMGFGDVKLAFNMGFFMGIKGGLLSVYFGFISGAIVGILLLLSRQKKLKSKIAFGPFLLLGMFLVLMFREPLFGYIARIYGF